LNGEVEKDNTKVNSNTSRSQIILALERKLELENAKRVQSGMSTAFSDILGPEYNGKLSTLSSIALMFDEVN